MALIARGRAGLEAAKRDVERAGGEAMVLQVDVADHDAVDRAASQVEEEFGPIDIWVNDAMLSVFSPIMEMRPDDYKRVTDVTYLGYVWGTLAALRRMKPRDRGAIVQVGSTLSFTSSSITVAPGAKQAIGLNLLAVAPGNGLTVMLSSATRSSQQCLHRSLFPPDRVESLSRLPV